MKKYFLYVLITISAALALNCRNSSKEKEQFVVNDGTRKKVFRFSFDKVKTPRGERIWKKVKLNFDLKIGGIKDTILIVPSRVKIDTNQNIYIEDWNDCSIKKFDNTGKFIKRYGKKGRGPGEFSQLYDFDVTGNGKIAALDPNGNKFVVFNNNKIEDIKCTLLPLSICFVDSNEIATFQMMSTFENAPIMKINYKNKISENYQNFLDIESIHKNNSGMTQYIIGDLHQAGNNQLIFVASVMGYAIQYNGKGRIYNAFKLINAPSQIKVQGRTANIGGGLRKEQYLFESSSVYNNYLYLLVDKSSKVSDEYYIDKYSIKEGKYLYSMLFKGFGKLYSVCLTNKKIFLVKQNSEVDVFNYEVESIP